MAESIINKFEIKPELIKSSGGVFEVYLNEDLVFSKKALGRHAHDGEVVALLAERL